MSGANSDAKLSLKVMVKRKENKFLYAEADSSFADVLLSFLTLPLGRIVKIMKKHYGDEAITCGSFTTLYDGLANLDTVHFWTEGAKSILLHPRSLSDAECKMLKLDISDSPPVEYFVCQQNCRYSERFQSVSVYNDNPGHCPDCRISPLISEEAKTDSQTVFTKRGASFFITEDLKMVPMEGLLQIVSHLGITDMSEAETMNVTFGFSEVMDLLKASFVSLTPLSDVVLNRKEEIKFTARTSSDYQAEVSSGLRFDPISLKVMVQKSTNKFLYAEAEEDFVNFLFSLLAIPPGALGRIFKGNMPIKVMNPLHSSVSDLIGCKYFNCTKEKLIKPKITHGYTSFDRALPHLTEHLPCVYKYTPWNPSTKFPGGRGKFVQGPKLYKVADDLTVTSFCFVSILSSLKEQKIVISDVQEVMVEIGLNEVITICSLLKDMF